MRESRRTTALPCLQSSTRGVTLWRALIHSVEELVPGVALGPIYDLRETEAICGSLPYTMETGIAETVRWFRQLPRGSWRPRITHPAD